MSKPAKPATVCYYVDADVLGLAKILVQIRSDVTYPGDPGGRVKGGRARAPCTITEVDTDDEIWIPETARQGWLIITRDRHIQDHRAEIEAVRSSGARMVNLAGDEAVDTFAQLEILMCQWRRVTGLLEETGPFIYVLTRTTIRQIPLSDACGRRARYAAHDAGDRSPAPLFLDPVPDHGLIGPAWRRSCGAAFASASSSI